MLPRFFRRLNADFLIRTVMFRLLLAVMVNVRRPISTLLAARQRDGALAELAHRRAARQPHLRAPVLVDPELALGDADAVVGRVAGPATATAAAAGTAAAARTARLLEHAEVAHRVRHEGVARRAAADALEAEAVVEGVIRGDARAVLVADRRAAGPLAVVLGALRRRPGRPAAEAVLERRRRARHAVLRDRRRRRRTRRDPRPRSPGRRRSRPRPGCRRRRSGRSPSPGSRRSCRSPPFHSPVGAGRAADVQSSSLGSCAC